MTGCGARIDISWKPLQLGKIGIFHQYFLLLFLLLSPSCAQTKTTGVKPTALNYYYDFGGTFRGLAFGNYQSAEEAARVISVLQTSEVAGKKIRAEPKKKPASERKELGQVGNGEKGTAHVGGGEVADLFISLVNSPPLGAHGEMPADPQYLAYFEELVAFKA